MAFPGELHMQTIFTTLLQTESARRFASGQAANPTLAAVLSIKNHCSEPSINPYFKLKQSLFLLLALLFFGTLTTPLLAQTPLPLPSGSWVIIANGISDRLYISGIDGSGNIQTGSTIFGNPITGYYDSTSARINFIRVAGATSAQQIYNGYLFRAVSDPASYFLTGEFSAYQGTGGSAKRFEFGWFAQRGATL
jgi:hypothetical protein